jgi:translation initiation factor IF-2
MRTAKNWLTRVLSCALVLALCGIPELLQAQSMPRNQAEAPPVQDQRTPDDAQNAVAPALPDAPSVQIVAQNTPAATDPSAPAQNAEPPQNAVPGQNSPAPAAPAQNGATGTQAPATTPTPAQAPPAQNPPAKPVQEPAGAAAAQTGVTAGGAASKPAGMAIAPAKQRQVRSFLIKLAAVGAGAAAIGTVVALSKGSPSKPPGAK